MRHLFIINPVSFPAAEKQKKFCAEVENCFSGENKENYEIYISRYPRDASITIYKYLAAMPPEEIVRVYAVGGDGILFDCLNGVIYFQNAELAAIPYGKSNDFVRSFGENKNDIFRDIKKMAVAPTILTDVIKCGSSYSIVGCALGVEAAAVVNVEKMARSLKRHPRLAAVLPALFNLGGVLYILKSGNSPQRYTLTFDGKDYSGKYLNINGSNLGVNGGTNVINPHARPDDGFLDAILAKDSTPLTALKRIVSYTTGKFEKHPDFFSYVRFKKMCAESNETMAVIIDGEAYFAKKVELEIIPNSIKIVAPLGEAYTGGDVFDEKKQ